MSSGEVIAFILDQLNHLKALLEDNEVDQALEDLGELITMIEAEDQ